MRATATEGEETGHGCGVGVTEQNRLTAPSRAISQRDARALRLRSIFSFAVPLDPTSIAVRQTQIDALVRLVPATVATQMVAAIVLLYALRSTVSTGGLAIWFGAAVLLCAARGLRALRLRYDATYARRHPTTLRSLTLMISLLAGLWLIPPLLWFGGATPDARLFMCVLSAVLMSAGSITLISVPQVAAIYILLMTVGAATLTVKTGSHAVTGLTIVYAGMLLFALVASARQFIANVRSAVALEEQAEIIALLREFEASGSGGLWELDAQLRFTNMSAELASAINVPLSVVIGRSALELLDPKAHIVDLSTGMRQLFDHLESGEAFRDIAVPAADSKRWWSLSGKPIMNPAGVITGWRGVGSDITDLRLGGSDAVRAARCDPLTGIANRLLVRESLEEALLVQWEGGADCALLAIDLDRFKLVNDTLGHAIGDQLLGEVARRLVDSVGDQGSVGRLGGDEFAVIWTGGTERGELSALASRLIAELSRTFIVGAATLHIGATIGIACGSVDGGREEALMRSADLALYRAKQAGRGGHAFFERFMFEEAEDHRLLENDVRKALESDGLALAFQPIVAAVGRQIVGQEALLRWQHPTRGAIAPDLFIPIIEDSGLIHQIGAWAIRQACAEAVRWPEPWRVAVNISAAQLGGAGLAQTVVGALVASGLDPGRLELEVTESVFLGEDAETLASLERLRGLGVRLVLDDFGKGYSSFGYLSRAHFSKIKIDQSFVRAAAAGERESLAIVKAILALASGLQVETTAEGVETAAQAKVMRALGCTQLQGYLYGRPEIPVAVEADDLAVARLHA